MLIGTRFSEVSGIIGAFLAEQRNGSGGAEKPDFERKYLIEKNGNHFPTKILQFQARLWKLYEDGVFIISENEVFAGIDEGWVFHEPNGSVQLHRLRYGSNRLPQLTMKYIRANHDSTERIRISTNVAFYDLESCRAKMNYLARLDPRHKHMLVAQFGNFWYVEDQENRHKIEIALYQVGRAEPDATSPVLLLAEIASLSTSTLEESVKVISKYEKLLGVDDRRLKASNLELFEEKFA